MTAAVVVRTAARDDAAAGARGDRCGVKTDKVIRCVLPTAAGGET
jgi:hypothetical protein